MGLVVVQMAARVDEALLRRDLQGLPHQVGRGVRRVLVGRDRRRPAEAAADTESVSMVAGTVAAMAAAIEQQGPAVVVNTVGPFVSTAEPVAKACLAAGSHYVDLANDVRHGSSPTPSPSTTTPNSSPNSSSAKDSQ